MAKLEFTVEIAAPPDRVFVFFVPQRMPYWYNAESDSIFEVQAGAPEFQVGLKVRITVRAAYKEISHTAVVTRYAHERLLEWRFQDIYGVRGLQRWELELISPDAKLAFTLSGESASAEAQRTRVRMRDEYELPGRLGRVVDWLLTRRAVARRDRGDLARLKRLAERK